ncbi:Peptidylglycine alpha-hydroxylating monooxygenase [Armadillidium vulgare]|nr:Peptidylglycine alpha-hydroxylating monooxygenase [Armadillidium vulgare]
MEIAHHMILTGCSEPGSTEEVWSCGDMASKELGKDLASPCSKNSQIMYAWAKDAPKLITLTIREYFCTIQRQNLPKVAGVLLMGTGGRILPHSIEYMETACTINENIVIHPFAFRTHTHSLGRVVSGYKIEMKDREAVWTLLGKKDPQLPQMFYNIPEDMTLSKGDLIAARCTMESNRDRVTRIGSTANDEMCNFYIMYWKEDKATNAEIPKHCFSMGPPYFYWETIGLKNIPEDASTLPVEERANEINSF